MGGFYFKEIMIQLAKLFLKTGISHFEKRTEVVTHEMKNEWREMCMM